MWVDQIADDQVNNWDNFFVSISSAYLLLIAAAFFTGKAQIETVHSHHFYYYLEFRLHCCQAHFTNSFTDPERKDVNTPAPLDSKWYLCAKKKKIGGRILLRKTALSTTNWSNLITPSHNWHPWSCIFCGKNQFEWSHIKCCRITGQNTLWKSYGWLW